MALPTDFSNLRIAREGPLPGYTGHIPGVKANVMGHSYSDGCKRGVAITNALRNNEFPKAIHLQGTEVRPGGRDDFYAQLSHAGQEQDPRAIQWKCIKRDPPEETRLVSGKVDMHSLKQCIGTTEGPAMPAERNMCILDLPYKDRKLVLKKTHGNRGLEYETVNEGKHRMSGYTGHTHGQQHVYAKTYGNLTRELRKFPAEPSTSDKYIEYEENRPLMTNKFELGHNMRYNHYKLLNPGEGNLGPLPECAQ